MNGQQDYILSLEDQPSSEDVQAVQEGLSAYNRLYAPEDGYQSLTLFLRTKDNMLIGGLLGETYWGWLHIRSLWIHENVRRQGYGGQMLVMAEQEAIRRGCHYAHLSTLSFQACSFYERRGYSIWGVLEDLPPGHRRYFLKKDLLSNPSDIAE